MEQENRLRASGGRALPAKQLVPEVKGATAQFDHVQPGRRIVMSLPQPEANMTGQGVPTDNGDEGQAHSARFTAAVLDVEAAVSKQAVRECAVFIVPQVKSSCVQHVLSPASCGACEPALEPLTGLLHLML